MGPNQLDGSDNLAEEGSYHEELTTLVSHHKSNVIGNMLVKSQAEDENQVEASQVLTASEKYQMTKARILSSGNSSERTTPEDSLLLDSRDPSNKEEESVIHHVGEKYQAEVPPLFSSSEQYLSTIPYERLVGFPIPVMWAQLEKSNPKDKTSFNINLGDAKGSAESRNKKKSQLGHNKRGSELNAKLVDVQPDHRNHSHLTKLGLKLGVGGQQRKMNKSKIHCLVPEIQYKPWNDADVDNFLLGLYIFGKSFVDIKRFIENKKIGDILSFYYGKFCGSNMHRRWSDCIKRRNKKRVWGKKLFSGWRLQELISRLLSHVTEENQNKLLEVSKLFGEERISIEEYVVSLKAVVGLQNLAKAVGISGKGKDDLTGVAMAPVCPKIPTGRACSSLAPSEIIKCLKGNFRLSKDQVNDIFWEAVWPRLLARGWQSEQPGNRRCIGSKNYLVFIKPGLKSFSKEKLVKGEDVFDSISDVLRIVASEPQLLDLDAEKTRNDNSTEVIGCPLVNSKEENICDHQNSSSPKYKNDFSKMEFTIVDTSSIHEGKAYRLRKLSDAIVDSETSSRLTCLKEEVKGSSVDGYEMDIAEQHFNEKDIHRPSQCKGTSDNNLSSGMQCTFVDTSAVLGDNSTMSADRQSKKTLKLRFKWRARPEYSVATFRSHGLTACTQVERAEFIGNVSEQVEPCCNTYSPNISPGQDKERTTFFLPEGNTRDRDHSTLQGSCFRKVGCPEENGRHQYKNLSDLNFSHIMLASEHNRSLKMEAEKKGSAVVYGSMAKSAKSGYLKMKGANKGKIGSDGSGSQLMIKELADNPGVLKTDSATTTKDHQPNSMSKRHSTRNRPLTAKAIEALESSGLCNIKKRKRSPGTKKHELDHSYRVPKSKCNLTPPSPANSGKERMPDKP